MHGVLDSNPSTTKRRMIGSSQRVWGMCVCVHASVCTCIHVYAKQHIWRQEDNFGLLVLSFLHVGSRESNSGCETWQQAPLSIEPSHWPWNPVFWGFAFIIYFFGFGTYVWVEVKTQLVGTGSLPLSRESQVLNSDVKLGSNHLYLWSPLDSLNPGFCMCKN